MKKHPCVTGRVRSFDAVRRDRRLRGRSVLLEVVKNNAAGPDRVRILMVTNDHAEVSKERVRLRRKQDPRSLMVDAIEDPRRPITTLLAAG